jgi:pyrroline-5-carboxylate reductase
VATQADILVLAVKPYLFPEVIAGIKDCCKEGQLVVSIAAGQTMDAIEGAFGKEIKLVRAMPNTPAQIGQAMSALCANARVTEAELKTVTAVFESFGEAEIVTESLMDTVVGVSGSSPAYVYMMIEAMADAAVADGMPRQQAYKFAAQSVRGAAQMVLQTGTHPAALKDAVCSPGGTTIAAVTKLEEKGFASAVIEAQRACVQKSRDMSKTD